MPRIPIPLLFPILTDADDFEDLCVDLLRLYWNRPRLERFGRRGERQFGIDILDIGGISPLHAAQCKLREYGKTLYPKTISEEVAEARKFTPSLGKYGILTTAKVSTPAQTRILEINQNHRELGLFEVELLTWDKLCGLLQTYDAVREVFYGSIAITATSRFGRTLPLPPQESSHEMVVGCESSVTADIDAARDAIRRHEFQIALLLLNRIQERDDHAAITNFQRFRIYSNLGFAEAGLGRHELAARHFLEALKWEPHEEHARINEVFAHILLGEHDAAYAKAEALRTEYPASDKLALYWIMSAPRSLPLSSLEAALGPAQRADADVSIALARRALMELNVAKGLAYAEAAAKAAPSASQPQLVIAQANMAWIAGAGKGSSDEPPPRAELECRVEETLAEALRLAELEHLDKIRVDALVTRTELRLLQRRTSEAEVDARAAHQIDADNVEVMIALSRIQTNASQLGEAINLLERAHRTNPRLDVEFMYGQALLRRGSPEDLETGVSVLATIDISSIPPEMRPTVASLAIQGMIRREDTSSATAYLDRVSPELDGTVLNSLRGYIAHSKGNQTDAIEFAKRAQSSLIIATAPETKEFLARLFMFIDRAVDALLLFQELFDLESQ
jgi:tetratricopeptide (TPR) repeat protein